MAETATANLPAFASVLTRDTEDALKVLSFRHPEFESHQQSWQILLDAFEGDGGFLDGSYIWPFPREDAQNHGERQAMARYHNYVESLTDIYVRFLFTQGVTRESFSDELNAWLEDTDGHGTSMDDLMKRFAALALVSGHAGVLVDKTTEAPVGPTKADERGRVVASVFTALSIADWRFNRSSLEAVKLIEAAPPVPITDETPVDEEAQQYLLWDKEGWARFNYKGELTAADTPKLDLVPLVILRPKPSYRSDMLGRPLISNANVVRALFNRASEEDQVLRDNAFSMLTVSVPTDGDVDRVKADLGNRVGSARAMVAKGTIAYTTPDQSVPGSIRDNIAYLVRELYRAAHVRFQREGLSAESGDSIRLQYTELNEMLQGFGKALARAEQSIVRAYFAWNSASPNQAEAAFIAASYEAVYPSEFFLDDLMVDLEAWAEAIRLNLGPTMTARVRRKAVRRIDPNIPSEELEKIDTEIEKLPADSLTDPSVPIDRGDPELAAMQQVMDGDNAA